MYKLLVVDDENETRNALCTYFPWDEMGFEIAGQAEDGKQALDFMDKKAVDVVLCDIRMPGMTGIDLARTLHNGKVKTKIIFLSGYRDFDYARNALSCGVKDYIVKPAKYKDLVEVFSKVKEELDSESLPAPTGSCEPKGGGDFNLNEKIISSVKEYVAVHYRESTLEDAAKRVYMNPNYLSQYFRQKTGQYFSDYLITVKMKKAMELLEDLQYKTYEVSSMIGYSNAKNFTRTFKNYFGKSPREHRNGCCMNWERAASSDK